MEDVWKTSLPRLNEAAPDFSARTTQGPRKLGDYRGQWLILFSHPADFTPVCTSEIVAFSRAYPRFKALGCELLGLSVDSTFSHPPGRLPGRHPQRLLRKATAHRRRL